MTNLKYRMWIVLALFSLAFSIFPAGGLAQGQEPRTWTHTTQADFMAGERHNLDARGLDALGTPYAYDADPRGAIRLGSRPGPFTKYPENPIFDVGQGDAWDNAVVSEAKVIFDGQTYHLWYAARQRLQTESGVKRSPMMVGYATSADGLHWTRHPDNPIMSPGPAGSPEANFVYPPYVLFDGQQFLMWYSANDFEEWSINYATSPDGAAWDKYSGNPLMRAAHDGCWDENFISEPSVLWNGERFEMWYNGGSERTSTLRAGYAWSQNGLDWQKWEPDEWVLDVGAVGEWDDFSVARVHVLYDGGRYQMFYEGHDGKANMSWRLGYAWSDDGLTWHKDPDNPIIDMGAPGEFDSNTVSEPYVIFDGQTYRLYYSAYDGDKYRIGLATAPPVFKPQGTFISPPLDGEKPTYWGSLVWNCRLPEGTDIRLEVATSDNGQNWSDWQMAAQGSIEGENMLSLLELDLPASRYLRYRATLLTDDPARSPLLQDVTLSETGGYFTLDAEPALLTLVTGETGSYTVSLVPRCGFDEPVSLAISGLPQGMAAYAGDGPAALPAEVSLSISSGPDSPAGTYQLAIKAIAAGGLTQTTTVDMIILLPTPTPLPTVTPTATPTLAPTATPLPALTPTPIPAPLAPTLNTPFLVAVIAGVALAAGIGGFLLARRTNSAPHSE